jgi:hypothetical protein
MKSDLHFIGNFDFSFSVIKKRKVKLILRISFWSMILIPFVLAMLTSNFSTLMTVLFIFAIFGQIAAYILTAKYYNWPFILFIIVIVGIYFKRQHWPLSGILMGMGTLLLAITSTFNMILALTKFSTIYFLKWFGFLTGVIVALFMTGLLFMNMYWSGMIRAILIYSGCFIFFMTVLGMIFTLPFSDFVSWPDIDRKVFYRTIILPMIFVLGFFILVFVFPETYNSLMGRNVHDAPWIWQDSMLQLKELEGIPHY